VRVLLDDAVQVVAVPVPDQATKPSPRMRLEVVAVPVACVPDQATKPLPHMQPTQSQRMLSLTPPTCQAPNHALGKSYVMHYVSQGWAKGVSAEQRHQ
jgi:hypothetical protein